ncbi:MAG: hypothetical protein IJ728_14750 [Selenomonadaceae bacterium]|nr:hypothetical protein [Selenomonadaceae bacterium]MBR1730772.1 hypothetical protein [Selenomonadaceae bacterium]
MSSEVQTNYQIEEENLSDESSIKNEIVRLSNLIGEVIDKQERNSKQLTQVLRENVNFQNQVRQGMQNELVTIKEQQRGEQFTPLLKEIAAVCVEYRNLLNDETISDNVRRTLQLLFDQLEDILSDYDAELFISQIGEIRKPVLTKIINTIATDDEKKHNTIAKSRRAGVVRGGHPLYREYVDVYVYDPSLSTKSEMLTTINND